MRIENLLKDDPFESSIYAERYLNDTKGRFSEYSEVNPIYDPQGKLAHISMPFALLRENECVRFEASPSDELMDWIRDGGQYRFFWHPDVDRLELRIAGSVLARPTSSTRTVVTEGTYRVYVKTDLDKKHFRFIRRLQRSSVEHSIAVCADLKSFCEMNKPIGRFSFLPETIGLVVQGGRHEGSGVIFRESRPYPFKEGRVTLLPYHALYADDPNMPEDKPLAIQLIDVHGRAAPLDYLVESIVGPLLETWVTLVAKRGLLPELHGQNAMAEVDETLSVRRLVYRDLQGTYSDAATRSRLRLPQFAKHIAGLEEGVSREAQYSHAFDGMLGRYLLQRLISTFCKFFPFEPREVASAIREYHHGLSGWRVAAFPPTTYRFALAARDQIGNEVELAATGEIPHFR